MKKMRREEEEEESEDEDEGDDNQEEDTDKVQQSTLRFLLLCRIYNNVDDFIFVGTNFHGLKKNQTFVGFRICVHSMILHNSF